MPRKQRTHKRSKKYGKLTDEERSLIMDFKL